MSAPVRHPQDQTARSSVRAEHANLAEYVTSVLTPSQRSRVLILSFNQWDFTLGAVADMAMALREMGSLVRIGLWSDRTPLHDVGWTTSRLFSRLLASPARDDRVRMALIDEGFPPGTFLEPPLRPWRPVEELVLPDRLCRSQIRQMTYRGSPAGRAVLQVHPDTTTPVTDDYLWPRRWVRATARSYAWVYDQTLAAIDAEEITAVVVYNGRFQHDRAAAAAAEARGLPVLSYDTGGHHTDFDLTIDATHDWDALQRRMLALYDGWPAAERDDLGSSWFHERVSHADPDNALYVESQRIGAELERPAGATCLVVYFSSSGDEIVELDLDWDAYFGGQERALRLVAEQCRKRPGYALVVRSHPHKRMKPKEDVAEWHAAVAEARPDIHLDEFSDIDSYALMRQADIVVTYGSTTGVEAAFAGKPVIVMGPCAYDKLGCAIGVADEKQLSAALDVRDAGSWAGAVSYGLMFKRRGFGYEHVARSADGMRSLSGVEFQEAAPRVLHLSHALNRLQRWWLTRH